MTILFALLWACALVGGVILSSILWKAFRFLTFHFTPVTGRDSLVKYRRQPRAWAVATGSSAGIGFGHIQEFAARGFGVIILANIAAEIDEAAHQIEQEFEDIAIEKIVLDATKATYKDIESAFKSFMHLPITILVNNVSVQTSRPLYSHFESFTASNIQDSIFANNLFTCNITHILYPVLKKNGPSLILNVCSGASGLGLPWLATYSGTKAFTESWSKAIARETEILGHSIDCIAILPGDVRSRGNIWGAYPSSPTSREFAKMALDRVEKAVGWGLKVFTPYWLHEIQIGLTNILLESMVAPAAVADIARRRELEAKAR